MESTATGPSASSSPHPSLIPLPDLQHLLTSTIKKRSDRCATITALLVSWDTDDTGAKEDSNILEKTLSENFRSIETHRLIIPETDSTPTTLLSNKVTTIILQKHCSADILKKPTLFIFYYSGHGILLTSDRTELNFVARLDRRCPTITWDSILTAACEKYDMDFLGIIDCCHSGYSLKLPSKYKQTVQVLTAVGASEFARSPSAPLRPTFTQRLCHEIDCLQQYPEREISAGTLFERLRMHTPQKAPHPRFLLMSGSHQIALRIDRAVN